MNVLYVLVGGFVDPLTTSVTLHNATHRSGESMMQTCISGCGWFIYGGTVRCLLTGNTCQYSAAIKVTR